LAGTSQIRPRPYTEIAPRRRPLGVNGSGKPEADGTLIAVQALAVDDFGVDVKIADELSEYQLLVRPPVAVGNDAGAMTADVHNHDGLNDCRYATTLQTCTEMHGGPMFISSR
jgi:hypothetical protein